MPTGVTTDNFNAWESLSVVSILSVGLMTICLHYCAVNRINECSSIICHRNFANKVRTTQRPPPSCCSCLLLKTSNLTCCGTRVVRLLGANRAGYDMANILA